ncbi:hypothetical protein OH76DRAFT_516513 [Lentinus brumalis]|uniref:Uncharacterized protein n=1 Tax=Lentinus brumalis TaxID=2498619 RepID=A0A371CHT6_9APHY|nr:hypothetical protein OH76DRAFT_516513 [Polyporus brumalis]
MTDKPAYSCMQVRNRHCTYATSQRRPLYAALKLPPSRRRPYPALLEPLSDACIYPAFGPSADSSTWWAHPSRPPSAVQGREVLRPRRTTTHARLNSHTRRPIYDVSRAHTPTIPSYELTVVSRVTTPRTVCSLAVQAQERTSLSRTTLGE